MNDTYTFHGVQHVSLIRPRDTEAATRRFYGEILGLPEVPVPTTLAHLKLIWFKVGDDELHMLEGNIQPEDVGQHLCLQVDNVEALRARLTAQDIATSDAEPIRNRPRFFCHDPFGNRIEVTAILGSYSVD